ncbi:putative tetratricopeptide repeat protein 1 [Phaeomoniella chlamydospora]|uniref:Putative tetratricopeptide repeat protein 1 n=1 Tax=Phaeomoniella chlamydospora TaxID=158046 RepID=A0A0G2GT35_PHACM|nr:putative tetratricopeptide repeat protein 1 [Phaeomoniella chlamydospora]
MYSTTVIPNNHSPNHLSATEMPGDAGVRKDSEQTSRRKSAASESDAEEFHDARFPPEEEASLLAESNATKSRANALFSSSQYSEALSTYDQALASCPNYLDYDIAVLQSNISACYIKLEEWKDAVDAATRSLDRLENLDPVPKPNKNDTGEEVKPNVRKNTNSPKEKETTTADDTVIELPEDEDETQALQRLTISDTLKSSISRIRSKSLLRRARARTSLGGWANLSGAEEDYRFLLAYLSSSLPPSDLKTVRTALRDLPTKINQAKEKEMGEMMGKLKELGNGILKPFGLSTENFKMVKDEKTGGYSIYLR